MNDPKSIGKAVAESIAVECETLAHGDNLYHRDRVGFESAAFAIRSLLAEIEATKPSSLRRDLMEAVSAKVRMLDDNAKAQSKETKQGLLDALEYTIKADVIDNFALNLSHVLQKHGL